MVRVGAVSSSSWTSLRREQAPPMGRGQASPQGREASTTSSPATTSALSFLTDVIVGAGSSTQPRPSAPSVSSSRPPNPAPRTPSAPSRYLPSSPCLFARILLTHPLPSLASLAGSSADSGARGARLADRCARYPVGPFPHLWTVRIRSLRGGSACTLFCCVACSCARVLGCVPCRRPFNSVLSACAGPCKPLWVHVVVAHL